MVRTKTYTTGDDLTWTYRGPHLYEDQYEDPDITNAGAYIREHGIENIGNLGNNFY